MKRAIIGSFAASLVLGAVYLGAQAISNLRLVCEDGGHSECAFTEETAHEIGRQQALGAVGCVLVGGGALLLLRSQRKA